MIRSSAAGLLNRVGRRRPPGQWILRELQRRPRTYTLVGARFQGIRSFSSTDEKPKPPVISSTELAPVGDGDNLPARLIDFQVASKIEGEESHVAIVELQPGETLRAEAGAMLFMTEGVVMDTNLSGASSAFSRMMTGQNMFLTDFRYEGTEGSAQVGLGTDFPSKILRFSLDEFENNSLICQRGAFLASNPSVAIEMEFTKSLTAGFFGGQGFVLQKLTGQGQVLIKGGGTIVCKELEEGQSLRVTSGSIVAFEPSVSYDVQMMAGVKNVMFGGEGLFITTLEGPGRVWLQGMPADRMIAEIARRIPSGGPGLGIPIGGGGGGGAGEAAGAGTEGASDEAVAEGAGSGEEMVAATDAAVEADRQATVASSGAMSSQEVDSESQSALFGDAIDSKDQGTINAEGGDTAATSDDFGEEDATWTSSSSEEATFTDDDSFTTDETTFKDEGFLEDSTTTDGLGEAASEGGGGILSTLWDIFTGGGD